MPHSCPSREAEAQFQPSLYCPDVDSIAVSREGEGPELLLVHGGASASTTWSGLAPLLSRWTLVTVHRRGFSPSPAAPDGRQDFEVDAADIEPLLDRRPHVVAHSYGALGALIAAACRPAQVRSLTLIEPPLFHLLPDDAELRRFQLIGDEALAHGLDADPARLREFLRVAGSPVPDDGPLPENVVLRRSPRPRRPIARRGAPATRRPARGEHPDARRLRRPRLLPGARRRCSRGRAGRQATDRSRRRTLRRRGGGFQREPRAVPDLGRLSPALRAKRERARRCSTS